MSSPINEEVRSYNSHVSPHHPQTPPGTTEQKCRACRTRSAGVPDNMQELWCRVCWRDKETAENTIVRTQ